MTDTSLQSNNALENETTHFGFTTVAKEEKVTKVAEVFHSVAAKYDIMNDLMSGGVHRLWKRFTIDCSGARPGQRILDLGGGTGDLTAKFSRIVGDQGHVVLADINNSMLNVGSDKLRDNGIVGNVHYVQANAEELPFPDDYFDVITISFCLRNVTDKDKALRSMFRVLKPGGSVYWYWNFRNQSSNHYRKFMTHTRSTCCQKWANWSRTMQKVTVT